MVVNVICTTWFGKAGAAIAIIGIVAAPITTGDTAFRSARLTIADVFKIPQSTLHKRILVCIPLFATGIALSQIEFSTIWKYLGLFNQVLSVITLWTISVYLAQQNKLHWLTSIPAAFMTIVCVSYLLVAPVSSGGFALEHSIGLSIGGAIAIYSYYLFFRNNRIVNR